MTNRLIGGITWHRAGHIVKAGGQRCRRVPAPLRTTRLQPAVATSAA
jgi:hypothetical protein